MRTYNEYAEEYLFENIFRGLQSLDVKNISDFEKDWKHYYNLVRHVSGMSKNKFDAYCKKYHIKERLADKFSRLDTI